jgi:hypothetical protein
MANIEKNFGIRSVEIVNFNKLADEVGVDEAIYQTIVESDLDDPKGAFKVGYMAGLYLGVNAARVI